MTTKWSSQDLSLSEPAYKIHAPFSSYSSDSKQWFLLIMKIQTGCKQSQKYAFLKIKIAQGNA